MRLLFIVLALLCAPIAANAQAMWTGAAPTAGAPVCSLNTLGGQLANCGASDLPILIGTSSSIGGGALLAGACSSTTVSVTGATTTMAVEATPVADPGTGNFWQAFVSSAGVVTVRVCAAVADTPTATTYNIRVIQ